MDPHPYEENKGEAETRVPALDPDDPLPSLKEPAAVQIMEEDEGDSIGADTEGPEEPQEVWLGRQA